MNTPRTEDAHEDFEGEIIDIEPERTPGRRRRRRWLLILALVVVALLLSRAAGVYLETLWFGSLGYGSVYWTSLGYELALFGVFAVATTVILRGAFWLLERAFVVSALAPRRILVNNQPVYVKPARMLKPLAWIVALLFGLIYGLSMGESWRTFALWLNAPTTAGADPVFGRRLGFYLFTLPAADAVSSWFLMLAFIVLCGACVYAFLSLIPTGDRKSTRLNSSHDQISYAVFCLKKKKRSNIC